MAKVSFSTLDRQSKATRMEINADDAVAGADVQTLTDALDAIILGSAIKSVISVPTVVDGGSAAPPADKDANRGNKWLFRTQDDTTGVIYTNEIGTADNTQLPSSTDDYLDLTAGVGLAAKGAWEAVWESPDGNTGTLLSIQQVNRKA